MDLVTLTFTMHFDHSIQATGYFFLLGVFILYSFWLISCQGTRYIFKGLDWLINKQIKKIERKPNLKLKITNNY